MGVTDERILEALRDEGNLTAEAISNMEICHMNYATQRLTKLTNYGLTQRVATGLYRITEEGEAFLNEELDVSELELSEDS